MDRNGERYQGCIVHGPKAQKLQCDVASTGFNAGSLLLKGYLIPLQNSLEGGNGEPQTGGTAFFRATVEASGLDSKWLG